MFEKLSRQIWISRDLQIALERRTARHATPGLGREKICEGIMSRAPQSGR
jgi:hypothetical protein